ncbi:MAG: Ig-like domain-containing protein, partial [Planctomycetia bacterium]
MRHSCSLARRLLLCLAGALSLTLPACGGGGGGPGPDGAGQGLELVTFIQNGIGNLPLNEVLEFRFSEPVDPATINVATLQVRRGPGFGQAVFGQMSVSGSTVLFYPQLPGLCDLSDSGFQPNTQYRITLVGYPEQFPIRNTVGQPLRSSMNFEFRTRTVDEALWRDGVAAVQPSLVSAVNELGVAVNGVAGVPVAAGNELVLTLSENIDPCTVTSSTVRFFEYQRGNPGIQHVLPPVAGLPTGRVTGFTPATDQDPSPFSWGAIDPGEVNLGADPQRIRAVLTLEQNFSQTLLRVAPEFGRFPENALCVLELTFGMKDLAGSTLVPVYVAFTTENLPIQSGSRTLTFEANDPVVLTDQSTADVNTTRSPGRAQGWMLFAGDGDNGANQLLPSLPNIPSACTVARQPNDGTKDDFDPSADVRLDTGLTVNTCNNVTDGSRAVVWEFRTLRVRAGRTVRIIGVNPAIILVQGAATVESGGRILARGDGLGGTSNNQGESGVTTYNTNLLGGTGYAGGGAGGLSYGIGNATNNSEPGVSGFGSPNGYGVGGGSGTGGGGAHATMTGFATGGNSNGGGGGGHATAGGTGGSVARANNPFKTTAMGTGGTTYPAMGGDSMPTLTA